MLACEFERITTRVRLVGAGTDGLGEDVSRARVLRRADRSAGDIGATPPAARTVNVKPSRIGGLRALYEVYALRA